MAASCCKAVEGPKYKGNSEKRHVEDNDISDADVIITGRWEP